MKNIIIIGLVVFCLLSWDMDNFKHNTTQLKKKTSEIIKWFNDTETEISQITE